MIADECGGQPSASEDPIGIGGGAHLTAGLHDVRIGPVEPVQIDCLVLRNVIRTGHMDKDHARLLAGIENDLPPILVHRDTNEVIDGFHRVHAAKGRGESWIDACIVDGSHEDVHILAVRSNTRFGKALTLEERERAARRILETHPQWSNRAIAEVCGLSGATVAKIRSGHRSTEQDDQLNGYRLGRDGKMRPLDSRSSKERAARILKQSPETSLRKVAREVGLSPATIKSVRDRLHDEGQPDAARIDVGQNQAVPTFPQDQAMQPTFQPDVALKSMLNGQEFLAWLEARAANLRDWRRFVGDIPASRIYVVADEARAIASEWRQFAEALEARVKRRTG